MSKDSWIDGEIKSVVLLRLRDSRANRNIRPPPKIKQGFLPPHDFNVGEGDPSQKPGCGWDVELFEVGCARRASHRSFSAWMKEDR